MANFRLSEHKRTVMAGAMALFTAILVTWWMVVLLRVVPENHAHRQMVLWEGSFLLALVISGGIGLTVLTFRDRNRFETIRFFFSTFSHDLKTSISRLRLQAEVLSEDDKNPLFKRLLQDINRLSLQLENSLWMTTLTDLSLHSEKVRLSEIFSNLRLEFSELNLRLARDALLIADKRAIHSVLRNLLQNSIIHGKATDIHVEVIASSNGKLQITIKDNGLGMEQVPASLGQNILTTQKKSSNGIGLFLTSQLVRKLHGEISFSSKGGMGFTVSLGLPGELL